jgi:hypothetical protein
MKICFYCEREILNGTKLYYNGIKYICNKENDLEVCYCIKQSKIDEKKQINFIKSQTYIKENGGIQIKCSCGNSFYTIFPLETYPPCDNCPYCGITHRQT